MVWTQHKLADILFLLIPVIKFLQKVAARIPTNVFATVITSDEWKNIK